MANKLGKLTSVVGSLGNILALPDALNAIKHVTENARPIIEKEMDRRYAYKQSLLILDDVRDIPIDYAQTYLENKGFTVLPVLVKPHAKYAKNHAMEVLSLHPKPGKYEPNRLVKLYFADDAVIQASRDLNQEVDTKTKELQEGIKNNITKLKKIGFKNKKTTIITKDEMTED